MNHKSPSETLYEQEDVPGCRVLEMQYSPENCHSTRELIREYIWRFCDVRDIQRIDMDLKVKGREDIRSARLTFFTHAQARQAEWRINHLDTVQLNPKLGKTLLCYPVLFSLCVEGNPREIGRWEKEPKQKIVERWRSPGWMKQETNDMGHEMLQIQVVEAKKGCFSDPVEKKYDTDYAFQLPYRGIHDVSFSVPTDGEDFCPSMKMRLIHPPDVFRWDLDIETLHKNLKRMDNWEYRCTTCNVRNKEEESCESCGDKNNIVTESPGNITAECPMGISCKNPECQKHLRRDLFAGNNGKTWINPLLRCSLQPKVTDLKDTLVQWKLHCRTFDEPETHLLQHIGECWVWVITFYTMDMEAFENFKNEIQGSVQVTEPDEIHLWQRNLPMTSSNTKVQKTYRLPKQVTIQLGINLWDSNIWPDAKANLEKYLLEDSDSLLKFDDGIDRFNQVFALQCILACFPSPIIREEILPYYQTGPMIDPDPGPSRKNRFFTHLQKTYTKKGDNEATGRRKSNNQRRKMRIAPHSPNSPKLAWAIKDENGKVRKDCLQVNYCMLALHKMREKFFDDERKYTNWFNRHHDKDTEQNRWTDTPGPSYYINQTLGRHPEAFLHRAEDFYSWRDYQNDISKHSKRENLQENKIWIKDIYVTPTRIDWRLKLDEDCRLFRDQIADSEYCCRVHLQEDWCPNKGHRKPWFWKRGVGFNIAARILMDNTERGSGIPMIGGFRFRHMFYSDKQVKDSAYWAFAEWNERMLGPKFGQLACRPRYGPQLAEEVVNSLSNWKKITNIGKKMARAALYVSGGVGVPWRVEEDQVEYIQDRYAKDGRMLTDGCGLISDSFVKDYIQKHDRFRLKNVAMIQGKYKGCKGMWSVLPREVFQNVLDKDDRRLQAANKKVPIRKLTKDLVMILPDSMVKFDTKDKIPPEMEVKTTRVTGCAMTSREVIGVMAAHDTNFMTLKKYQTDYCTLLNRVLSGEVRAAKSYLEELRNFGQLNTLRHLDQNRRSATWQRDWDDFWEKLKFNKADHSKSIKEAYVKLKNGFKIMLRYPSVRMKAIVDWTGTLEPGEIFIKTQILESATQDMRHTNFEWSCPKCLTKKNKKLMTCVRCNFRRQTRKDEFLVYEGDVGLMKNPCLHATSWIRAKAVYNQYLDKLFPHAEVFLFCGKPSAEYCLVNKLSGGDLDGDDFLVVTQKDLLPKLHFDKVRELLYDEVAPVKHEGLPTNEECVDFFVNYQTDDMVSIISQYHEAWSNKKNGILNKQCLELAKLHSVAIDYAKNNNKVEIDDKPHLKRIKFPHYLGYPQTMSQKYPLSLKGKLWDSCFIPQVLKDDYMWYKRNFGSMEKQLPRRELKKRPIRQQPYCSDCGNRTFRNKRLLEEHYKTPEHTIRKQQNLEKLGLRGSMAHPHIPASHQHLVNVRIPRKIPQQVSNMGRSSIPPYIAKKERDNSGYRGNPPVRNYKRQEVKWERHWNEERSWPPPVQQEEACYDGGELWDADLSFQYIVHTEAGSEWKPVEDLNTVLELNAIWREHLKGNADDLTWTCEKSSYVYDLRHKVRRRGTTRPLRWGTLQVLENSKTAHLVNDLSAETLKKWCGYIEKEQIPPPKTYRSRAHYAQNPRASNVQHFNHQPVTYNTHKTTYPSSNYLAPLPSIESKQPPSSNASSEPLGISKIDGDPPLIKKIAKKEEERILDPSAKPFLPTIIQGTHIPGISQGNNFPDRRKTHPPQYSIWRNTSSFNPLWMSSAQPPLSAPPYLSRNRHYSLDKPPRPTEMDEVDITRDIQYLSTKEKIEEITNAPLTFEQINVLSKMWVQIRGIESPQDILRRFMNEQILN